MRIAVIGAGYVGLVVAAALSAAEHAVICVERDPTRRLEIASGRCPFFEPGLDALLRRGALRAVESVAEGVAGASMVFMAVGTPPSPDGDPDTTAVFGALPALAGALEAGATLVLKSTVPVGTADRVRAALMGLGREDVRVLSNPEFLAEGTAVDDFLRPARVVIGGRPGEAAPLVAMYRALTPEGTPILVMDNRSAELAKYAANVMLAARVSLMNELARLCDGVGADVERVRTVVGADPRIGASYLRPGAGYGGSCFPKDLVALESLGARLGFPMELLRAVRAVNVRQRHRPYELLLELAARPSANGLRVALWGVAFKPHTDDTREAPALVLVEALLADGAEVVWWDAAVADGAVDARAARAATPEAATEGADALVVLTEWPELLRVDLADVARRMRGRIAVDGRNMFEPGAWDAAGLCWVGIGRRPPPGGGEGVAATRSEDA